MTSESDALNSPLSLRHSWAPKHHTQERQAVDATGAQKDATGGSGAVAVGSSHERSSVPSEKEKFKLKRSTFDTSAKTCLRTYAFLL